MRAGHSIPFARRSLRRFERTLLALALLLTSCKKGQSAAADAGPPKDECPTFRDTVKKGKDDLQATSKEGPAPDADTAAVVKHYRGMAKAARDLASAFTQKPQKKELSDSTEGLHMLADLAATKL